MLVARLSARAGADVAHIDPKRLLRDAFEPGDLWFVTGDLMQVDVEGDYWFIDRQGQPIVSKLGVVPSTRIEDALYDASCVALCIAFADKAPDGTPIPVAAIQLGAPLDLDALNRAVAALPEYARPRTLRIVDAIPLTDGFRPIKRAVRELPATETFAWDARTQRYERARSISLVG
jgi:acyl-CoA synthetase (AMP-forming)/AMP-acid ligase II